jgi:hypothetical protein
LDGLLIFASIGPIEQARLKLGPARAVAFARSRGSRRRSRDPRDRRLLRAMIARVDALMPGGPNCYRRALLEMALDACAAEERLHFGLSPGGGQGSGHAWLESWGEGAKAYAAEFVI